jgi:hypothetical protein
MPLVPLIIVRGSRLQITTSGGVGRLDELVLSLQVGKLDSLFLASARPIDASFHETVGSMYLLDLDAELRSMVLPHLAYLNHFADNVALLCCSSRHARPPLVRTIERVELSPLGYPERGRMCELGMASSTPPPDGPIAMLSMVIIGTVTVSD